MAEIERGVRTTGRDNGGFTDKCAIRCTIVRCETWARACVVDAKSAFTLAVSGAGRPKAARANRVCAFEDGAWTATIHNTDLWIHALSIASAWGCFGDADVYGRCASAFKWNARRVTCVAVRAVIFAATRGRASSVEAEAGLAICAYRTHISCRAGSRRKHAEGVTGR